MQINLPLSIFFLAWIYGKISAQSVTINKLLIFLVSLYSVIYTIQELKHRALLYGYLFGDVILNNNLKLKLRVNYIGIIFLF